jgi:hypothetical protein
MRSRPCRHGQCTGRNGVLESPALKVNKGMGVKTYKHSTLTRSCKPGMAGSIAALVALLAMGAVLLTGTRGWQGRGGADIECPGAVDPPRATPEAGAPLPPRRSSLSVATLNAEWLFDGVGDGGTPRGDPFLAQVGRVRREAGCRGGGWGRWSADVSWLVWGLV